MTEDLSEPVSPSDDALPLNTRKLTWSVLLAQWTQFARSALALPTDEQGSRLRQSIADIIALQSVWFALQEINQLPADELALGLDRAAVLIEKHSDALEKRWAGHPLPSQLRELVDDARDRLHAVQSSTPESS